MVKIIGLFIGILFAGTVVIAKEGDGEKASYEIDIKESKVYWTGNKVTGKHSGYLLLEGGTVSVEGNSITGADVIMDMSSIVCTDIKSEKSNKRLVDHLRSPDFFSVEEHPIAKFEITYVENVESDKFSITGDLSIKGIKNEVTFPATVSISNDIVHSVGAASIDRTKWDIKYRSGEFFKGLGDKMIYDEFDITFNLVAKSSTVN